MVQIIDAASATEAGTSMPTLLDYLGVYWKHTESPTLLYKSPNLPDETKAQKIFRHSLAHFGILVEIKM